MIRNRYNLLLLVLVLHLVALALDLPTPWTDVTNLAVAPLLAVLVGVITGSRRDAWVLLGLAAGGSALNVVVPWGSVPLAVDLAKVALWTLAPAFLAQRVFRTIYRSETITAAEIAGAVAVYLLLAHVFANFYEAMYTYHATSLYFGGSFDRASIGFGEMLYFSLITLSTLGYGDVAPASPLARGVAVMESVVGLMYVAILIARFVAMHTVPPSQRS
ncbi:MAG: hypothetical protein IPM29_08825 [Planctomycetes bacterium]|nr:hypothetical protein [Planctomycetota bacterium]